MFFFIQEENAFQNGSQAAKKFGIQENRIIDVKCKRLSGVTLNASFTLINPILRVASSDDAQKMDNFLDDFSCAFSGENGEKNHNQTTMGVMHEEHARSVRKITCRFSMVRSNVTCIVFLQRITA